MSSYYYLMAQLPGILPTAPLPFTFEKFREIASRFLSSQDKEILDRVSLEPPRSPDKTGSELVDRWFAYERSLRLCLGRLRAAKLRREVDFPAGDDDAFLVAKTAADIENPLSAERYLDSVRAHFVDQLRGNHYFDSDAVFAYGLMVLIRARSDRFTADAGRASYTAIYNQILGE